MNDPQILNELLETLRRLPEDLARLLGSPRWHDQTQRGQQAEPESKQDRPWHDPKSTTGASITSWERVGFAGARFLPELGKLAQMSADVRNLFAALDGLKGQQPAAGQSARPETRQVSPLPPAVPQQTEPWQQTWQKTQDAASAGRLDSPRPAWAAGIQSPPLPLDPGGRQGVSGPGPAGAPPETRRRPRKQGSGPAERRAAAWERPEWAQAEQGQGSAALGAPAEPGTARGETDQGREDSDSPAVPPAGLGKALAGAVQSGAFAQVLQLLGTLVQQQGEELALLKEMLQSFKNDAEGEKLENVEELPPEKRPEGPMQMETRKESSSDKKPALGAMKALAGSAKKGDGASLKDMFQILEFMSAL